MSRNIPYRQGEVTLWEGRPAQSFRYSGLHFVFTFVGGFMLLMIAPPVFMDVTLPEPIWARVIIGVMVVHLLALIVMFLFGVPYLDIQHRAATQYKLTNKRAMIIDSSPINSVFVYELQPGLRVDHVAKSDSVLLSFKNKTKRTIMPIETDHRFTKLGRYFLFFNQLLNTAGFRFIIGSDDVAKQVKDAIKDRHAKKQETAA
ncbi:hypothetical protein [Yoonia sp. R2-816]|uniref:hypothetical protein n=1 Tax=Yoonia sp. R2-816 TaxID=3342638 RepID=UPI00372CAE56